MKMSCKGWVNPLFLGLVGGLVFWGIALLGLVWIGYWYIDNTLGMLGRERQMGCNRGGLGSFIGVDRRGCIPFSLDRPLG